MLEHLRDPLGFVQSLSFAAAWHEKTPLLYFEVPCIDRAIETRRTVDFYYEHNSHFTTKSFMRMLDRCAGRVRTVRHGYDGEVIYGFVRLGIRAAQVAAPRPGTSDQAVRATAREIQAPARRPRRAAAPRSGAAPARRRRSSSAHGLDAGRFPTVVDSDPDKAGTYVPGTGQEIRVRNWLIDHPAEVIIIPPQWRARDIVAEMDAAGIAAELVLIEHGGRLIDYFRDPHPYREAATAARVATAS